MQGLVGTARAHRDLTAAMLEPGESTCSQPVKWHRTPEWTTCPAPQAGLWDKGATCLAVDSSVDNLIRLWTTNVSAITSGLTGPTD